MDADCDESDDENITPLSEFEVLNGNKEVVSTICVTDINEVKFFLGME